MAKRTPPGGLNVVPETATIAIGVTQFVFCSDPAATWSSSDPAIASMDGLVKGAVLGVSAGTATITARHRNKRGTMTITVLPPVDPVDPPDPTDYGPQGDVTQPAGSITVLPGGLTIHQAVAAAPPGATFWLTAGIYAIYSAITPKTGQTFVGEYGAILDGSAWVTTDLEDGIFRSVNNGITDVTIRNLVIRHAPEYGIDAYLTAARWTVQHCEIANCRNGISLGVGGLVEDCWIHHNAGVLNDPNPSLRGGGYTFNSAAGTVLRHNEISYNGQEQKFIYATHGEASQGYTIAENFVHHNLGDGLWIDGDGAGSVIEDNVCEDNGRTGITVEIGTTVIVRNNTVRRHTAAEGILISASRACTVTGNVLEGNLFGIGLYLDFSRLAESYPFWTVDLRDNTLTGNTVQVPSGGGAFAALLTTSGAGDPAPYFSNAKANHFDTNTYQVPNNPSTGAWFVWDGNKAFPAWQAIPQDAGSTIGV